MLNFSLILVGFAIILGLIYGVKKRANKVKEFYDKNATLLAIIFGALAGLLWIFFYEHLKIDYFNVVMIIVFIISTFLIRSEFKKDYFIVDELKVDISNKSHNNTTTSLVFFLLILFFYVAYKRSIILTTEGIGSFVFFTMASHYTLYLYYLKKYIGGNNE